MELVNRCVLCLRDEESVDHIFIHCVYANMVWDFFLIHLRISWSWPSHLDELMILDWWICDLEVLPSIMWSFLSVAICWGPWKERNRRIFDDKSRGLRSCVFTLIRCFLFGLLSGMTLGKRIGFLCGVGRCSGFFFVVVVVCFFVPLLFSVPSPFG